MSPKEPRPPTSLASRRREALSIRELERVCELLLDEVESLKERVEHLELRQFRLGARLLLAEAQPGPDQGQEPDPKLGDF